jgi:hypothetical protein
MVEIIYDSNLKPELTVALPVYNSKKIAWLALESLCNQIDINFNWELIIYEENHSESVFPKVLDQYLDLIKNNKCSRIVFISGNEKVLLIDKWISIANNSSKSSKAFLLQAADCYSPNKRLKNSYDKIVKENYDWYDQTKGYFYSFISDRVILYDFNGVTNLNMGLKTKYIRTLPKSDLKRGIDGYIYNHCLKVIKKSRKKIKHYYDNVLYTDSVDTHGLNNISIGREVYFTSKPNIFKVTNLTLNDFTIGAKINNRLNNLNNVKYDLSIIISTYKNTQYLDDCFNSIIESIGNKNVEVLIGIDSCMESYNFVLGKTYPSNFKFYFFKKNNGPYIVFNSLSKISKSDNIMFFGSDDIMDKNMVGDVIDGLNGYDCVKPVYINFNDGDIININSKTYLGEGVFGVKKSIFNYLNGFEPWMCAADSDFMGRLYKNRHKLRYTNRINFYRRIHKNGLTSRPDTGMSSPLRAQYAKLSRNKKVAGPLKIMVTEPYSLINGVNYLPKMVYDNDTLNVVDPNYELMLKLRKESLAKVFNHENYRVATPVEKIEKKISSINYEKINNLLNKVIPKPIPKVNQVNNTPENKKIITNKEMVKLTFPGKKNRRSGDNTMSFGGKINK